MCLCSASAVLHLSVRILTPVAKIGISNSLTTTDAAHAVFSIVRKRKCSATIFAVFGRCLKAVTGAVTVQTSTRELRQWELGEVAGTRCLGLMRLTSYADSRSIREWLDFAEP